MKKISSLLFVCFSLLFFASCKKDSGGSSGSNYYMKASIDGTTKTFSSTPLVIKFEENGTFSYTMSANAGGASLEGLALQITQSGSAITTGSYTDGESDDYVVGGSYNPGSSNLSDVFASGLQISTTSPLKIVISNITASTITGTFSGEFFDNSGAGSNSIMITNGEFNLPIQ